MRQIILALAGSAFVSSAAIAADMPVKAKVYDSGINWTGYYVGGHVGYAWTSPSMSAADRAAITATYGSVPEPKGFAGGVHAGYDYQFANRMVLGIAAEVNGFGIDALNSTSGLAGSSLKSIVDWDIAVYGRLGYAFDRWMPYVLLGGSFDHNKVTGFNGVIGSFAVNNWHTGWTLGGGVEMMIARQWSGRLQYRYVSTDTQTYLNRQVSSTGSLVDIGISYRF